MLDGIESAESVIDATRKQGDLKITCDVVIVGSGAGGAVVAAELAEAGQDVVLLEEGVHIPPAEYQRMRPTESMRHMWRDGGLSFAIGLGDTPLINVMMGKCVGGSSVLTGGVCFRVPESVLDHWSGTLGLSELTPKGMEPYFESVERTIHVEEVPAKLRSRSTQLFAEGANKLGYEMKSLKRNTDGCEGKARCNFGCPKGAKLAVDRNYLPKAFAHGARLLSGVKVERVTRHGDRATGIVGRLKNGPNGKLGGVIEVHAKRVVLAASAFGSPLILARSGLGRASGQLGRNMTLHPGFRVMARFDESVRGWDGALQSAYTDALEDQRITMIGLFTPPGVLAATMPGIGPEHVRRAKDIPHMTVFGGMLHDDGGGSIREIFGKPVMTYRMSRADRSAIPTLIRTMANIYFAAGAREVFLPVLGLGGVTPDRLGKIDLERVRGKDLECGSQHPLGTCRMGVSKEHAVVDPDGQAWEMRELYVADGSVLPTSLGVNPQLSVMSMALRISHKMRERPLPS